MEYTVMIRSLTCLSLLLLSPAAFADAPGAAEAEKIRAAYGGYGDMSAKLRMVLKNADGQSSERKMRFRTLEKPAADVGDYSLVVFDSPSDVKGTALLSHAGVEDADQQWLYLPAAKRVRRIAARTSSGPFLGSEFAYEDITGGEITKHDWRLLGTEDCGKSTCVKLETRPKYEGSGYVRRIVWADQKTHHLQRIDFYDRKDVLLKTLSYEDYRTVQKHARAHRWVMKNHQSGKTTELVFDAMEFGKGYSDADFNRAALKRIR